MVDERKLESLMISHFFFGGGGVSCELSGGVLFFEELLCSVWLPCSAVLEGLDELDQEKEQANRWKEAV